MPQYELSIELNQVNTKTIFRYLNIYLLISWLSERQYAPEGGFAGRTNKLVDGCYSHWVGGCWPLLEAAIHGPGTDEQARDSPNPSLYSRDGLKKYILACCQSEDGGLRDKPSKYPDGYHTCYTLAGLSATQYYTYYTAEARLEIPTALRDAFQWTSSPYGIRDMSGDLEPHNQLTAIHPIFVIPWRSVERAISWFGKKETF
ncbi:MAG: hypothetical protein Q9219_002167 [cf. Caloplaca sp. 3 TL-2023]